VLLSSDREAPHGAELQRAVELTIWLVDEGWTVMTRADSVLAEAVRSGAAAMHGTYRAVGDDPSARLVPTVVGLSPRVQRALR
jgi:hypothetical protein